MIHHSKLIHGPLQHALRAKNSDGDGHGGRLCEGVEVVGNLLSYILAHAFLPLQQPRVGQHDLACLGKDINQPIQIWIFRYDH